jgi:hypothetical protein
MKQIQLHIGDISVGLALALAPQITLKGLADSCARSIGEVHNALNRLRAARLLVPDVRMVEREPLLRFIRWGVPHAFPPSIGPITRGIATARLVAAEEAGMPEPAEAEFVWPDPAGRTQGQAFAPPYPRAPRILSVNPELRRLLSVLDLVRVGGVREQEVAVEEIGRRLARPTA